jgi:ArsR family transcriptional regulator, lead/cadmium/zinc/bismuth-responsive transcriptional repressor
MASEGDRMSEVTGLDGCAVPDGDPSRVREARRRLVSPPEAQQLADLFRLLGDPTRARLLYALLEEGELCVCDLAETVGASETSVSHALRLLRASGVVSNRRAGRQVFYRLADVHVRMLLDLSREHLYHQPGPASAKGPDVG